MGEQVSRIMEKGNSYKMLVVKPFQKRTIWKKNGRRMKYNIKIELSESGPL
jgi:hypothetical protein